MELHKKIEKVRNELHEALQNKTVVSSEKVLTISRKLDDLIKQFYNQKNSS